MSGRSNKDWLEELCAVHGPQKQELAREELKKHINKELHDYLMRRRVYGNPYKFSNRELYSLSAWPQQVAQETLEKLTDDDFALLKEFELRFMSQDGSSQVSFLHWAASLVVFEELRGKCDRERKELAFQNLACVFYDTVYYFLNQKQAAFSEDCVQKTIEKVVRDECALLDTFKAKGRFSSWLKTIVINEARRGLRALKPIIIIDRQDEGQDPSVVLENLMITEREDEPEGKMIRQENKMEQPEVAKALYACLDKLTKNQRVAILGQFFEGRSGEELAEQLNRTPNAVFLLRREAKRNLRKCLGRKGLEKEHVLQILEK